MASQRREKSSFPIPAWVVIVSKYNDDQIREAARRAEACGYVLKGNLMTIRELLMETDRKD